MIKVQNLSYSFPEKDLYNKISFTLEEGQHCAFIGTNGSGKSTLTDLIMNPDNYLFDGKIEIDAGCKIGYVSQFSDPEACKDLTVFEYIAEEFLALSGELASICTAMETASELDPLLEQYQQTLDALQALGGDDFESIIHKKLNLANLTEHRNQLISEVSGGEFKLIQVIKQMLHRPDLMIMDEPDVFLDFENINALRNLLNSHKGTLLVITHNRYLLNHCFDKIIHLENKELQEFDGGYADYNFSLLESKIELQELANADAEEIKRNAILIDRLRATASCNAEAARGKSLNARVKIQERLEARRIKPPFLSIKQPNICFTADCALPENIALTVNDYSVSFEDILLEHVSFEIGSTDKAALIGANGIGKTTLLREIFQNDHASIKFSENIHTAYISQIQGEMLDESNTIMEEFFSLGFRTYNEIISYVSDYGFDEKILNQKISSLSGGEKSMLQVAKVSACKANMLLLDEPTSHLDTYSQVALEEALKNYTGAILMSSHDFYFIANCMDYVLIIEDKTIRKMSIRKFRKMIYSRYFDKNYLEMEEKKKTAELKIELALKDNDFALAKTVSEKFRESSI
ncbi:MAG: ABC-F family ATP-binding cassette domain-containing protein [Clostridium sp.]